MAAEAGKRTAVYLRFFGVTVHVPNRLFVPDDRDATVMNILKYAIHDPDEPGLVGRFADMVDSGLLDAHRVLRSRVHAFAMTKDGKELDEDAFRRLIERAMALPRDTRDPWKTEGTEIRVIVSETPFSDARPHHLIALPRSIPYKDNDYGTPGKHRTQWRLAWSRAMLSAMPPCFDKIESVWTIVQEHLTDEFLEPPSIKAVVYDGSNGSSSYAPHVSFHPTASCALRDFLLESVARSSIGKSCTDRPHCKQFVVGPDNPATSSSSEPNKCFRRDNWTTGASRYIIDGGLYHEDDKIVYVDLNVLDEEIKKANADTPPSEPPVWRPCDKKAQEKLRGYAMELKRQQLSSEFLKKEEDEFDLYRYSTRS